MNKLFLNLALGLMLGLALASCDLADQKANRMHNGTGVWLIEQIDIITYDSNGTVLNDSVIDEPGELIFFSTGSLNALFDYYQGLYIDYGPDSVPRQTIQMEYYIDAKRADIRLSSDPLAIGGLYNVEKFGRSRQEWARNTYNENYTNLMHSRTVLHLRKNKSFKD